jgi:hypothetical protein
MKFEKRKGLEGPFTYSNGRTLYYDNKEGQYWDPLSDFYIDHEEIAMLQQQIFDKISGSFS